MAKSITVGKRENEKKRLAKREEKIIWRYGGDGYSFYGKWKGGHEKSGDTD